MSQKGSRGYERLLSRQSSWIDSTTKIGSENKKEPSITRSATMRQSSSKEEKGKGKTHPVLKILGSKNKEKAMMKPEFLRYLEYMREAGTWDPNTNSPMMYYFK